MKLVTNRVKNFSKSHKGLVQDNLVYKRSFLERHYALYHEKLSFIYPFRAMVMNLDFHPPGFMIGNDGNGWKFYE